MVAEVKKKKKYTIVRGHSKRASAVNFNSDKSHMDSRSNRWVLVLYLNLYVATETEFN